MSLPPISRPQARCPRYWVLVNAGLESFALSISPACHSLPTSSIRPRFVDKPLLPSPEAAKCVFGTVILFQICCSKPKLSTLTNTEDNMRKCARLFVLSASQCLPWHLPIQISFRASSHQGPTHRFTDECRRLHSFLVLTFLCSVIHPPA